MRTKEIKEVVNTDAFKVASVDNIKVLLQYAKAYAGRMSNIWYGTSIQCVDPKPRSLILSRKQMPSQSHKIIDSSSVALTGKAYGLSLMQSVTPP